MDRHSLFEGLFVVFGSSMKIREKVQWLEDFFGFLFKFQLSSLQNREFDSSYLGLWIWSQSLEFQFDEFFSGNSRTVNLLMLFFYNTIFGKKWFNYWNIDLFDYVQGCQGKFILCSTYKPLSYPYVEVFSFHINPCNNRQFS